MSQTYFELKQQRQHCLNKADSILKAAENAHRELTTAESLDVDAAMVAVNALNPRIAAIESKNTLIKAFPNGQVIIDGGRKFQKLVHACTFAR